MIATRRPVAFAAERMRLIRSACSSKLPWEKLSRATLRPERMRRSSMSGESEAGPIVATILVLCVERAMELHELLSSLAIRNDKKIVLLVIDGLGGMSHSDYGYKTELEYAKHPTLDRLASLGTTGMLTPILPGVTPGSGP